VQVGTIIVPISGAAGIGGCVFITTFAEGADKQPDELATVKVNVPEGMDETVVETPEPEIVTPPGVLVSVQAPVAGNPLKTTLPVEIAQGG
jgi:hypothetical protein